MQVIITGEEIIAIVSIICMAIVLCVICITASKCGGTSYSYHPRNNDIYHWEYSCTEYQPIDKEKIDENTDKERENINNV